MAEKNIKTGVLSPKDGPLTFWQRHRLSLLLIIVISTVLTLTVVSVFIYTNSGAAQLDLSRPGYRAVSDQVESDSGLDRYSSNGPVTDKTIQEFIDLYKEYADKARAVDAFSGDPLNPEVLVFDVSDS